jgi:hypothetical protein
MVSTGAAARPRRRRASGPGALVVKAALLLLVIGCLLLAVGGGLLRAGAAPDAWSSSALLGQAAVLHAALMMSGFLGTMIAVERAVALKLRAAFVAPFASALGALLMFTGQATMGAWLSALAALAFVGVSIVVVLRQTAAHTVLLLVGALGWLIGNGMLAAGLGLQPALPWWFAFIVLTIAAERLEMTRLTRRHPLAEVSLFAVLLGLLAGAALSPSDPLPGGALYGTALLALAAWLARFDIARHTLRAQGLTRYMAVCLLSGYAWLALAGLAWIGMAFGCPGRDLALHALGLGFIVSMVMGHAPVILPAVARIKLLFGRWFYLPLALLHASLALRLIGGLASPSLRSAGAALNALALAAFMITVLASAWAWRRQHAPTQTRTRTP